MEDWNARFQEWLEASYLYYIKDNGYLMSDYAYDMLASNLLKNWECVTHSSKALVTEDDLRCGSAYTITADQYPEDIKLKYA